MNSVKYVEVSAKEFLAVIFKLLQEHELMNELMIDDNYIFRIYPNAVEVGYPVDKPLIPS